MKKNYSKETCDLIQKILVKEPDKRPTIDQIIQECKESEHSRINQFWRTLKNWYEWIKWFIEFSTENYEKDKEEILKVIENVKNENKEKIIEILKKYTFDEKVWENFTPEMNIKDDLKINSARVVDIVLDLEECFDIEISDEDIEKMKTVKDVIETVERKN